MKNAYKDKKWLLDKFYKDGLSKSDIALLCKSAQRTISKYLKSFGVTQEEIYQHGLDVISRKRKCMKMSEEQKENLRNLYTGKKLPEETKRKISASLKGKKKSKEHAKKVGLANKGRKVSQHAIDAHIIRFTGIDNPNYGKPRSEETKKKISDSNKGRIFSLEHRKKISNALRGNRVGNKNHNWKGGFLDEYPSEWNYKLKKQIRKRDNYRCQVCGKDAKCVHHIDYDKYNCKCVNLITLCMECHTKTTFGNRDYWEITLRIYIEDKMVSAEMNNNLSLYRKTQFFISSDSLIIQSDCVFLHVDKLKFHIEVTGYGQ